MLIERLRGKSKESKPIYDDMKLFNIAKEPLLKKDKSGHIRRINKTEYKKK